MDIIVENLTKRYGHQKAVDDISFTVKTGEVLGFLGPNGAGKTTTMKSITSFIIPDTGIIKIGNYIVNEEPEEVKKHIGYLPESNPLYSDMPVIDYLKFIAELHGVEKELIRDRILEMVNICGLEGEKHKKIEELSKGYQQRVGLAQAMIHNPEVLILDEPTSGLDPNQIVEIRELIRKIGKEKTVIMSSHILAEVEATCDRILIINKGKIVGDGTAKELRNRAQGREMIKIRIDGEGSDINSIYEALKEIESVEVVDFAERNQPSFQIHSRPEFSSKKEIFNLCVAKGWILTEMTPIETRLEDIFRELTN